MPSPRLHRIATRRSGGWAREEGVIALEFALLAPIFLVLIIAVMVLAIYFATVIAVSHAAAEGARAAVGGLGLGERQTLAAARVDEIFDSYAPFLTADQAEVAVVNSAVAGSGATVVTVTYPLNTAAAAPLFSLLSFIGAGGMEQPDEIRRAVTVANGGY